MGCRSFDPSASGKLGDSAERGQAVELLLWEVDHLALRGWVTPTSIVVDADAGEDDPGFHLSSP